MGSPNGLSKKALPMSSPNWDLIGVRWESGVHWEYAGSPKLLFQWALQMDSPKKFSKWAFQTETWLESAVSPLEVHWESAGCLLGVWFVESMEYFQLPKQLFQLALQMGSPKKFSKWALQTETWLESAGNLLGVRLESAGSPISFKPSGKCKVWA